MANLRWIWQTCIRHCAGLTLLAILLTTLSWVFGILVTSLQRQLVDEVIVPGDWGRLPYIAAMMGCAFIGSAVLYVFDPHVIHLLSARIINNLSDRYASHLYEVPLSWLQGERSGKIGNYLGDAVVTGWTVGARLPLYIASIGSALLLT